MIVALDYPSGAEARKLVAALHAEVRIYKIGLELICADGLQLAGMLVESGSRVFLDAKFLDIPNTVERATANAAQLGASFLTVHGTDLKTLDAAMRGRGTSETKLLAITVLTSLDAADLESQGIKLDLSELVLRRAAMAREAGFDGVVASAQEAEAIRREFGPDFLIVTPGIRPADATASDQSRVVTPSTAIAAGADYLVVGRPITAAADPYRAADRIIAEIETALASEQDHFR
ncbi:MAG: orotidine-5'-phosphate decarboxylase [Rhodomicrobium sp.]|nr:orotidine-5'-phosphate decarboxylase [Rhodomicrobium sp.]